MLFRHVCFCSCFGPTIASPTTMPFWPSLEIKRINAPRTISQSQSQSQSQSESQSGSTRVPIVDALLDNKPKLPSPHKDDVEEEQQILQQPQLVPAPAAPQAEGIRVGYDEAPLEINLDLAIYRAKSLVRRGRPQEAEQLLRKCIKSWPTNGRPYVVLGGILSKQGRLEEARVLYENGCQATEGDNSYVWQGWAVVEQKLGRTKKARKLYDAAIVANKRHVAAWHAWACLEIREGNLKKARELLMNGLKNCGPNAYIFHTSALLEVKARRFEKARTFLIEALKHNPNSCPCWLSWAELEVKQGNTSAARRLFERAVQASPKNRFAWQMWAMFEASQGKNVEARKYFRVGIALNPKDAVILQSLAIFEYNCISGAVARKIFERASEVDPNHQSIWNAWGWMEWKEGDVDAARKLYQRSLSINSRNFDASICFQQWGQLEQGEGNIETARRLFKLSIDIDSQSYAPWSLWATLEEKQGNMERAEEIRTRYFQQRTEVTTTDLMDVNLAEFLAPAIGHIRNLLNFDFMKSQQDEPKEDYTEKAILEELNVIFGNGSERDESFDVDSFIHKKLNLDVSKLHFHDNRFTKQLKKQ